jgi:hypothetical protein
MSYTITKSDGTTLVTIPDGTADTSSTNLTLPGANYVGYGYQLNENLVHLLENFAANSAPTGTNIQGQLWFNKSDQTLNVFTDIGYVPVSGVLVDSIQPVNLQNGTIWFNSTTNQLNFYNNGTFQLIGPLYTAQQGVSGAIPVAVTDFNSVGVTHNVIKLQYGSTVLAIFSSDPAFVPTPAISGFPLINQGVTLNNTLTGTNLNSNLTGNVVGNLTGNVVGNLTGNVVATTLRGTLTGNVIATTLSGALTGNVVGNLTGNVIATTLSGALTGPVTGTLTGNVIASTVSGNLTGNVSSTYIATANFSTSNAQITGGSATNLATLGATSATLTNSTTTTAQITNLSTGNAQITSGNVTGIANLTATNGTFTNVNTGSISVTGGAISGLTTFSAITAQLTNLSTGNAKITGGNVSVTNGTIGTGTFGTFSSAEAQILGGNVTGITNFAASSAQTNTLTTTSLTATNFNVTNIQAVNFSTSNAQITGGNITDVNNIYGSVGWLQNFSTGNALITGGSISGLSSLSAVNGQFYNSVSAPTITATTLYAATIGNTGATLVGTLSSGSQTSITGVGTLTSGTWNASLMSPQYGGTGVNNGSYTLTLNNSYVLNQDVSNGASPTFTATNFSGTATNLHVGSATGATSATTAVGLLTLGGSGYSPFSISQVGGKLYFYYNGTAIASLDSSGNFISASDITAFGTP